MKAGEPTLFNLFLPIIEETFIQGSSTDNSSIPDDITQVTQPQESLNLETQSDEVVLDVEVINGTVSHPAASSCYQCLVGETQSLKSGVDQANTGWPNNINEWCKEITSCLSSFTNSCKGNTSCKK